MNCWSPGSLCFSYNIWREQSAGGAVYMHPGQSLHSTSSSYKALSHTLVPQWHSLSGQSTDLARWHERTVYCYVAMTVSGPVQIWHWMEFWYGVVLRCYHTENTNLWLGIFIGSQEDHLLEKNIFSVMMWGNRSHKIILLIFLSFREITVT